MEMFLIISLTLLAVGVVVALFTLQLDLFCDISLLGGLFLIFYVLLRVLDVW